MKRTFFKTALSMIGSLAFYAAVAQENMHPSPAQNGIMAITNAVIHVGNGQVINGSIVFDKGKITYVGPSANMPAVPSANVTDAMGKQVYPGIIATNTNLGLIEVSSVRATNDQAELGDMNPNIRSLVAYNTDSKVINTLRSNGVLLAHVVPSGGSISGSSSVVQLDAWNWEDAAYKADNGIHYNMPALVNRPNRGGFRRPGTENVDPVKQGLERLENTRRFLREAKAYAANSNNAAVNLKFEALRGLFDRSQILFVHCDLVKEMMMVVDLTKEFNIRTVIVGGTDSWMIASTLKENNIPVILSEPHSMPATDDDDVDQPYKTGAALQRAGVLFTIMQSGFWEQRNIPFLAGTMAGHGISREEALTAITLSAAKILGIDDRTGSLEVGKDANIVVSEGDILDMKTSKVTAAFIQGRKLNLDNKQTQLFERYKYKYNIR